MKCETTRLLLSLHEPGRTAKSPEETRDEQSLALHLTECPECRAFSEENARFDAAVGRAMFAVPVPAHLGTSISIALEARRVARVRRRVWSGVGIAASALLAIGLTVPIVGEVTQAKKVDPSVFVAYSLNAESDPFQETRDWLETQGVTFMPTEAFDLTLMTGHSTARLQRQSVPMLRLRHTQKQVFARIYVLKSEHFDLKNLKPESLITEYGVQIALVADALQPDKVAYLVVYTGDSLEAFLRTWTAA